MNDFVQNILLLASLVTAFGTLANVVLLFGKGSKKGISSFIKKEMAPQFQTVVDKVDEVDNKIVKLEDTGDSREMKRLRYECLCFASDVRKGEVKTRQEYEEIFRMETDYDNLIEKHDIQNGFMEEEMLFVHEQYRKLSNK